MKDLLFSTLKDYKKEYLPKDIFSGIIMAAVSIPISMGYAQIAGLPADYMVRCSRFCSLHYFQRPGSLSLGWMRHRQRLLGQHLCRLE